MPNRMLRDGILTSERVNVLRPEAELFYRRLMSVVDDYGRYKAHPAILRAACFPLQLDRVSEADIETWLAECAAGNPPLIRLYMAAGKRYLQLDGFGQRVRQANEKYPGPPAADNSSASGGPNGDEAPDQSRACDPEGVSASADQPLVSCAQPVGASAGGMTAGRGRVDRGSAGYPRPEAEAEAEAGASADAERARQREAVWKATIGEWPGNIAEDRDGRLFASLVPDNAITRYEQNMRDHMRNNPRVREGRMDLHWFLEDGLWKHPYRPSRAVDVDYAPFAPMGAGQ